MKLRLAKASQLSWCWGFAWQKSTTSFVYDLWGLDDLKFWFSEVSTDFLFFKNDCPLCCLLSMGKTVLKDTFYSIDTVLHYQLYINLQKRNFHNCLFEIEIQFWLLLSRKSVITSNILWMCGYLGIFIWKMGKWSDLFFIFRMRSESNL